GHFSPYSDGEKGLAATPAPNLLRWRLAKSAAAAPFAPLTGRRWRQPDEGQRRRSKNKHAGKISLRRSHRERHPCLAKRHLTAILSTKIILPLGKLVSRPEEGLR
ncbi:hypothetical protein FJ987_26365, partial [Mesorhizobium sp. CU2]